MDNRYVFVADANGERKATFLVGTNERPEYVLERVRNEYPDCTCFIGNDNDYAEFVAANKLYIDGQYVKRPPYVPPLEDVKAAKIAELKSIRDAKEVEPIRTAKGLFDYDDMARDRIQAAIIALNGGGQIEWTLADNTNVTVTNLDLEDVVRAVAVRSNTLHVTYRQLKEQVMAAQTAREVNAITWREE